MATGNSAKCKRKVLSLEDKVAIIKQLEVSRGLCDCCDIKKKIGKRYLPSSEDV